MPSECAHGWFGRARAVGVVDDLRGSRGGHVVSSLVTASLEVALMFGTMAATDLPGCAGLLRAGLRGVTTDAKLLPRGVEPAGGGGGSAPRGGTRGFSPTVGLLLIVLTPAVLELGPAEAC